MGGVSCADRRLHLPVKHLLGLLTLGPGEAPLAEAALAPQLACFRLHPLETALWDWWVIGLVVFQEANHSAAFVWQHAVLHGESSQLTHSLQRPAIGLQRERGGSHDIRLRPPALKGQSSRPSCYSEPTETQTVRKGEAASIVQMVQANLDE